jgi:hypothetical protein
MKAFIRVLVISTVLLAPLASSASDLHPKAVVPDGKTYIFFRHGKLIATMHSQEKLASNRVLFDTVCVGTPCPPQPNFPAGAICWVCR